ncbi:flagellar motor switch phosphatase FliY [Liquorilactobacillus vini]|uniref:Flagellar motor switch protein n=1 Tax=Liquorilactobacillus vini DSM 20605 TaxID=1133569 RepID=A0A0A7RMF9_9LACO|nr:flagellar motor switch phosphatase FliY [Liquorilactobacillus vini]AJA34473.1 flagellar motor switch protein FliY [Liquorilactobacillus vini DSM 20605]KRM88618.1 flagellar motor switch protein [Liquorilactobacillus vini DSM 20605]
MSDSLSQEEIDKLMHGNGNDQTTSSKEEAATAAQKPEATGKENAQSATAQSNLKDEKTKQDIIGEVGNISMSQAATTLSSILNHRVTITTPHVTKVYFKDLIAGITTPKVAMTVAFKEGLVGTNLMLLKVKDAIIIADLMMGGKGEPKSDQFTEIELSAVSEAMNQMIGSAATAMATMINRKVDILPPDVKVWKEPQNITYDNIDNDQQIYQISFSLDVEGSIHSEIMQIFTEDMVEDIVSSMMADKAEVVKRDQSQTPAKPIEQAPQSTQAASNSVTQNNSSNSKSNKAIIKEQTADTSNQQANVDISKPEFQTLKEEKVEKGDNLDLILDVPLNLSVVLGRTEKTVRDILSFNSGSVIELDRLTDEPLDILLNGKLIATGEVVVINENFGIRITNIVSQRQRIDHMG